MEAEHWMLGGGWITTYDIHDEGEGMSVMGF